MQKKDYARNEIKSLVPKADNLQRKLNELNVDEGQEAMYQNDLNENTGKLQQAKSAFEGADIDNKMRMTNSQLRDVEQEIQEVTAELAKSTKQADDRATLGLLKKELESRQNVLGVL